MLVKDKFELSVRLVIECLQTLEADYESVKWERESNTIKASVSSKKDGTKIDIVGVSIEEGKKCMVSLFNSENDRSLGQAILLYGEDLGMRQDIQLPLEYESYTTSVKKDELIHVLRRIGDKLGLQVPAELKQVETDEVMRRSPKAPGIERETSLREQEPSRAAFRRPADMPGFEDEYQIHQERSTPSLGLRGPESGYGDSDLYPTGQKYPNLADPNTQMPPIRPGYGQGGMTFDPLQEQARRREEQEGKLRGPGWIPGAKFDDPYGHPGFGGSGGSGSSGFAFGGGGFI